MKDGIPKKNTSSIEPSQGFTSGFYFSEKKTYDAAVEKAISKFLSAKTMPPSIGYDDLTMSR